MRPTICNWWKTCYHQRQLMQIIGLIGGALSGKTLFTEGAWLCFDHRLYELKWTRLVFLIDWKRSLDFFGSYFTIFYMDFCFYRIKWYPPLFQTNLERGFHTLCLLDIKVAERSIENMMKDRKIFEPPRFMTVAQASDQLLKIIQKKGM